ncbi:MAG TPA: hypothetical protein VD769_14515 [Gaiellaceae bacterium]|nr:hypothetical protein [Gaiellaceae bacterium]
MRALAAAAALAAFLGAAGCGGGEGGTDVRLRVVAPDNNIRVEGVECAGARPFEDVHAGTPFALEDGAGEVLAEGELPPGHAVNADPSIDWGVERIPTVCVFELQLEGVRERDGYALRLAGGPPLEFDAALLSPAEPLELVVP